MTGKSPPYGRPVRGSVLLGPVVPRQPPRMLGQMTKYRSRVDRLARPHHQVPPAGIVLLIVPGHVGIARQGMANEHRVVTAVVEPAIGLVGHGDRRQGVAPLQIERLGECDLLGMSQRLPAASAIAAGESLVDGHRSFSEKLCEDLKSFA